MPSPWVWMKLLRASAESFLPAVASAYARISYDG
jgi:hypothetical protein